jgi:RimJ/RimL family protein N-acetyltransferase
LVSKNFESLVFAVLLSKTKNFAVFLLALDINHQHAKATKIEAGSAVRNYKSIRVLEKSGMTQEGIYRKILPIRGEWVDSYIFSIIEDERN